MANISRRRTGELTRALFHILKTQPEGMRAADALAALEKQVVLTEYEAGDYETGGRRFEKIVRFSTVAPVKAGWLVKDKGIWTLTPEGEAALHAYPDPEQFIRAVGQLYKKWKSAQPVADEVDDPEGELTEESASITLKKQKRWHGPRSRLTSPRCRLTTSRSSWPRCCVRWVTTLPGSHRPARTVVPTSLPTTIRSAPARRASRCRSSVMPTHLGSM